MQNDESSPDYALVTSIRLSNGGEVLSVFGDRAQTGAYITRKLTDPAFVAELDAKIFDRRVLFPPERSGGLPRRL